MFFVCFYPKNPLKNEMAWFSWKINACDFFSQTCFFCVSDGSGSIWATTKMLAIFLSQARWKNTRFFAIFRQKKFLHVSNDSELIWAKTNKKQFLCENFRLQSDFASFYLKPKFLRICKFFLEHAPKSNNNKTFL